MDSADGPVVLVEAVEEGAHAVVPHLDHPAVEARQDPWPPRVEGQALDPVALGLELGEHPPCSPGDDQSAGESEEKRGGLEEDLPLGGGGWICVGAGDAEEEGGRGERSGNVLAFSAFLRKFALVGWSADRARLSLGLDATWTEARPGPCTNLTRHG